MKIAKHIVCRARNVELLESRPDLPRQTYEHGTRVNTDWNKSAGLDHCNTVPVNKNAAGSVSLHGSRSSSASMSSTNFPPPRGSLLSQTSSKNSMSRSGRLSNEDKRINTIPSYRDTQGCLRGSNPLSSCSTDPQSSEVRRVLSVRNTTQSSSSCSSLAASSSNQRLPVCDGRLPCPIISELS